jgi:hypothetical protein
MGTVHLVYDTKDVHFSSGQRARRQHVHSSCCVVADVNDNGLLDSLGHALGNALPHH